MTFTDLGGEVSLGLELLEEGGEEEGGEEEDDGPEEDVWDEGSVTAASRPDKLSLQLPTFLQRRRERHGCCVAGSGPEQVDTEPGGAAGEDGF